MQNREFPILFRVVYLWLDSFGETAVRKLISSEVDCLLYIHMIQVRIPSVKGSSVFIWRGKK